MKRAWRAIGDCVIIASRSSLPAEINTNDEIAGSGFRIQRRVFIKDETVCWVLR